MKSFPFPVRRLWSPFLACAMTGALMRAAVRESMAAECMAWVQRTDVGSPGQRVHHAMTYDSDRSVVVFFGGEIGKTGSEKYFDDTWEYDGMRWTQIDVCSLKPAPRSLHSMAYDPSRKRVVLYGGFAGGRFGFDDTWEYQNDGQRAFWIPVAGRKEDPGKAGASLVFSFRRGRVMRHGGIGAPYESTMGFGRIGDVNSAEWNGNSWIGFASSGPGVWGFGMAYDAYRGVMLVFGGYDSTLDKSSFTSSETWQFRNDAWSNLGAQLTGPSGRASAAMSFDEWRGRTVMVGGDNGQPGTGEEVWEYASGQGWLPGTPLPAGAGRAGAAMVYDRKRRRMVLMGGAGEGAPNSKDGGRFSDTWEYALLPDTPTYVGPQGFGNEDGSLTRPYRTVRRGVEALPACQTIVSIQAGDYPEGALSINKPARLEGRGGAVRIR